MLNHVEMTVPPGTLTEEYGADLDVLLCDILGWSPGQTQKITDPISGTLEVVRMYQLPDNQFVVLHEHTDYVKPGNDDHFGVFIDSTERMHEIFDQCKQLAEKDDRVSLKRVRDDGKPDFIEADGKIMSGFYIKYLMPQYIDIQTVELKN